MGIPAQYITCLTCQIPTGAGHTVMNEADMSPFFTSILIEANLQTSKQKNS